MQTDTKISGTKYDKAKPRMDLLDMDALEGLAAVLSFGAEKYEPYNWRLGIVNSRLIASMLRHLSAIQRGEDLDPESGLSHIDHLGCNWMFLSYNYKQRPDLDDRPSTSKENTNGKLSSTTYASGIDWVSRQLCAEQSCSSAMGQLMAQSQQLGLYDRSLIDAVMEYNTKRSGTNGAVEPSSDELNEHPGYYPTPFGYLSEDIAKANLALQKELDE